MREQKNKSQKGIIVFLAFIAVCMVCIIVLLASNIITSQKPQNNAKNEDSAQSETLIGDNENAEEETIDDLRDAGIDVEASTEGREIKSLPGYKDTAEWADEPITPTKVENLDVFDEMIEDAEDAEENEESIGILKQNTEELILKYAEAFECYAEPTIITEYIGYNSIINGFFVDFHTLDNTIMCFSKMIPENNGDRSRSVMLNSTTSVSVPFYGENITLINPKMCYDLIMMEEGCNPYQYSQLELADGTVEPDVSWKETSVIASSIQQGFSEYCTTTMLPDIVSLDESIPVNATSNFEYAYIDDWEYSLEKGVAIAHIVFIGQDAEHYYTLSGFAALGFSEDGSFHSLSQKEMDKTFNKSGMETFDFTYLVKNK